MTGPLAGDTFSHIGAMELAQRIEGCWRDRGYEIETRIDQSGTLNSAAVFGVRSDLVRGLPRKFFDELERKREARAGG